LCNWALWRNEQTLLDSLMSVFQKWKRWQRIFFRWIKGCCIIRSHSQTVVCKECEKMMGLASVLSC
jgi:hypothetical protein